MSDHDYTTVGPIVFDRGIQVCIVTHEGRDYSDAAEIASSIAKDLNMHDRLVAHLEQCWPYHHAPDCECKRCSEIRALLAEARGGDHE